MPTPISSASDIAHSRATGRRCWRRMPSRSTKAFCAPIGMISARLERKPAIRGMSIFIGGARGSGKVVSLAWPQSKEKLNFLALD